MARGISSEDRDGADWQVATFWWQDTYKMAKCSRSSIKHCLGTASLGGISPRKQCGSESDQSDRKRSWGWWSSFPPSLPVFSSLLLCSLFLSSALPSPSLPSFLPSFPFMMRGEMTLFTRTKRAVKAPGGHCKGLSNGKYMLRLCEVQLRVIKTVFTGEIVPSASHSWEET